MSSLKFIHLSDIHFNYKTSGGHYDLDEVIRHELLLDAAQISGAMGGTDGIMVSGDIAFSGNSVEYGIAYGWLDQLCRRTSCSFSNVWTVPGNHDIDRSKIKDSPISQTLRNDLRQTPLAELNEKIRVYLENADSRKTLFDPLEHYNSFAANFGCCSTANPLFWTRDLTLNDGSTLRLWGMNSAIISDAADSDAHEANKLILSEFQTKFLRDDAVVHLTMCHHPLEWLRDRYAVEDWFNQHARIQLFGHRHVQRVGQVNDNIRVAAGAVQPDRREAGWEPRYNFITLEVRRNQEGSRTLRVTIDPRVWNDTAKKFLRDQLDIYQRELPLNNWQSASAVPTEPIAEVLLDNEDLSVVLAAIQPDLLEIEQSAPRKEVSILNAGEKLTSRYLSLPHNLQMQIARKLGLSEGGDEALSDTELYRRYFKRAKDKKLLERLWSEVEDIYLRQAEDSTTENPFAGR